MHFAPLRLSKMPPQPEIYKLQINEKGMMRQAGDKGDRAIDVMSTSCSQISGHPPTTWSLVQHRPVPCLHRRHHKTGRPDKNTEGGEEVLD